MLATFLSGKNKNHYTTNRLLEKHTLIIKITISVLIIKINFTINKLIFIIISSSRNG